MPDTLSDREHAQAAKDLIKECGGVEEVKKLTGLSDATLSRYSNAQYRETMPAALVNRLEVYCGKPLYSSAMAAVLQAPEPVGEIDDVACDLTEAVAHVQSMVRKATADGRLTPLEVSQIAKAEAKVKRFVAELDAILRAHDGGPAPRLRAVS